MFVKSTNARLPKDRPRSGCYYYYYYYHYYYYYYYYVGHLCSSWF